ncbi:uncharacterized protein LOC124280619 [Haliotis rubra]|uniref:uncharacterized protein LOC124280619 n=1 Tax=Haliotis rubra TaxID=36100 RepID=UPI001EE59915|nr:uncharacterized protein LOC124280619 [Haliotis rubra]
MGTSRQSCGGPTLEDPVLVQQASRAVNRLSEIVAKIKVPTDTSKPTGSSASTPQKAAPNSIQIIRKALEDEGISGSAADIMLCSWRDSTQKQYGTYLCKWMSFCTERSVDPMSPSLSNGLAFLADLYKQGLSYSALNTARSALSSVIKLNNMPFGQHDRVVRFMKGVFNLRPSLPKNCVTWDVNIVLSYLQKIEVSPNLKQETLRLVMLLLLLSGQSTILTLCGFTKCAVN